MSVSMIRGTGPSGGGRGGGGGGPGGGEGFGIKGDGEGGGGGGGKGYRAPQSRQSVPMAQSSYSEPVPPSSQKPSPTHWGLSGWPHSLLQLVARFPSSKDGISTSQVGERGY